MIAEKTKTSRIRRRQSQCLQQGRRRYDGDIIQPSEAVWYALSTIYDTLSCKRCTTTTVWEQNRSQTVVLVHICTCSFSKISTCDLTCSTYEDHYTSKLLMRFPSSLWGDGVFGEKYANARRVPETILECAARLTNEYESLWIMVMLVASAISTSTMMILKLKVCRLTAMYSIAMMCGWTGRQTVE